MKEPFQTPVLNSRKPELQRQRTPPMKREWRRDCTQWLSLIHIFQAIVDTNMLERMLAIKNGKTEIQGSNDYFLNVMCLDLFCIMLNTCLLYTSCKDCETKFFILSRVEENQYNAMRLFEMTGNNKGMFAVRFPEETIYLIPYDRMSELKKAGFKRIDATVCRTQGMKLSEWLKEHDEKDGWSEEDAGDCKPVSYTHLHTKTGRPQRTLQKRLR